MSEQDWNQGPPSSRHPHTVARQSERPHLDPRSAARPTLRATTGHSTHYERDTDVHKMGHLTKEIFQNFYCFSILHSQISCLKRS